MNRVSFLSCVSNLDRNLRVYGAWCRYCGVAIDFSNYDQQKWRVVAAVFWKVPCSVCSLDCGAWEEESGPTFATETHAQGESGMASRISWSLEAESLRNGNSLEWWNAGNSGDGGGVLWDLVLALKATESSESPFLWALSKEIVSDSVESSLLLSCGLRACKRLHLTCTEL